MLKSLIRQIASKVSGERSKTPAEIRELIDRGQLDSAWQAVGALAEKTPNRETEALCLRGDIAFRRHADADAEGYFREALTMAPGLADAHYGLSLILLARGERESALRHAQFAVNNGTAPRLSAQLGLCQIELRNYLRAGEALRRATRLDPTDKASWNNLGIARRAVGDLEGAQAAFARALDLDPSFVNAAANARLLRSDVARRRGEAGQAADSPLASQSTEDIACAIDACEVRATEQPDDERPVLELAQLYRQQGDAQTGMDALRAFLARFPDNLDVMTALGLSLVEFGEFKEAKPLIQRALSALPNNTALLLAMADIRFDQGQHADAGELIEHACNIDPSENMCGRLAANLAARCKYEEALAIIAAMEAKRPAVARDTIGIKVDALTALGRHEEVLPELNTLIDSNPNDPNRRFLRASINLLQENFGQGWEDYAYRNLQSTRHLRMLPFPLWQGEPLEGKTILVAAEQGLGDQVMFASCLPDLLALGPRRVIVEVVDRVAPTLARSFPGCEVIPTKQDKKLEWVRDIGSVDYFVLIGDLPRRFRTQREQFPNHAGYFAADPAHIEYWRSRLAQIDGGARPRIGISWRGGTEMTRMGLRTMKVTDFGPMAAAINASWVCLQYGKVDEELAIAADAGLPLVYWPEAITDLDQFAGLIRALDLVVTVCNTTVHYAGALGKPVWVLAPKVPEWRYGLFSSTMPWYPSSKVIRQSTAGDWSQVVQRVVDVLPSWCQEWHLRRALTDSDGN